MRLRIPFHFLTHYICTETCSSSFQLFSIESYITYIMLISPFSMQAIASELNQQCSLLRKPQTIQADNKDMLRFNSYLAGPISGGNLSIKLCRLAE